MPTAKRASMREGPLAALFRKTAEDIGDAARGRAARAAGAHSEPEPEPDAGCRAAASVRPA